MNERLELGPSGAHTVRAETARHRAATERAASQARSGRTADATRRFEELFAQTLVKELRRGLDEGFFGSGPGADTFEGWFDEHLGASLAESGVLELRGFLKVAAGGRPATGEGADGESNPAVERNSEVETPSTP